MLTDLTYLTIDEKLECSPIVLFTHSIKKTTGAVHTNGDADSRCKRHSTQSGFSQMHKLPVLALLPTLYSQIFADAFFICNM